MRMSSRATKSSKKGQGENLDLKYRCPPWTRQLLVDFANERFPYFVKKWQWRRGMAWLGGEEEFKRAQDLVRAVWRGGEGGAMVVTTELGLAVPPDWNIDGALSRADEEPNPLQRSHIYADWDKGTLQLILMDLNEHVWMALLQESRHLAICKNSELGGTPGGECSTPYFLKYRPQQEFCSEECAKPRQRETKRRWWDKHGKQWVKKRKRSRK